jgi:hypothetical protein
MIDRTDLEWGRRSYDQGGRGAYTWYYQTPIYKYITLSTLLGSKI